MFTEIYIKDRSYRLALTTRGCVQLEKALNKNPLQIFMDVDNGQLPKLTDLAAMLQVMLQKYNHGISGDSIYDLIDDYLDDGHNMFDLIPLFVDVFTEAGFISKDSSQEVGQDPNA